MAPMKAAVTTTDAEVPMKMVKQSKLKRKGISKMAIMAAKAQAKRKTKDTAVDEPEIEAAKEKAAKGKKGAATSQATKAMKVAVTTSDSKVPMKAGRSPKLNRKNISKMAIKSAKAQAKGKAKDAAVEEPESETVKEKAAKVKKGAVTTADAKVKKGAVTTADAKAPVKAVRQTKLKKQLVSKMAKNLSKAQAKRKAKDTAGEEPESEAVKGKAAKVKKGAKASQAIKAPSEEETKSARTKELKAMAAVDLKALLESKNLQTGKKDDMIATLLKVEAKARAETRAHEAKVKSVVDEIRKDLDTKSSPELKELCAAKGIKVGGDKTERIQRLIQHSKESGEIEKTMAQNARNARRVVLSAMEKPALLSHCEKAKIDPLVQEVMVERLFNHEVATGKLRPAKSDEGDEKVDKAKLEKKRSEFKAMDIAELKKLAQEKDVEVGKKDIMVQALLTQAAAVEIEAARKKELKAMGKDDLKELVASKCLPAGDKLAMVDSVLAHEATIREVARKQKAMEKEVEAKKTDELSSLSATELKELCSSKNLKLGGGKEERVERLVQAARDAGEIDEVLLAMAQAARREELSKADKASLKVLCDKAGIDTIIKEVLVERVVAHEFDVPPTKKKPRMV